MMPTTMTSAAGFGPMRLVIVMIESLKSAAAINISNQPQPAREPAREHASGPVQKEVPPLRQPDPPGEAATLSAAIQRLISERDSHRSRAGNQEYELLRLRAVNEELRRQHEQTALIRDHYMRLATEVITTLKHIDTTIHEVVQKTLGATGGIDGRDATLISLACRLSPKGVPNGHAETHL
jgi:hypothetical protein